MIHNSRDHIDERIFVSKFIKLISNNAKIFVNIFELMI